MNEVAKIRFMAIKLKHAKKEYWRAFRDFSNKCDHTRTRPENLTDANRNNICWHENFYAGHCTDEGQERCPIIFPKKEGR